MENLHHITLYLQIFSIIFRIITLVMENKKKFSPNSDLKLLDQVRETLRYYHYARSTERSYCQWIMRYIYFFEKKVHPRDMGEKEIERFLSHLATHEKVSVSTQRQALNALAFLHRDVLLKPLDNSIAPVRSKPKRRPPTVLTEQEVKNVFDHMRGTHLLMARLIYGSGIRLMECIRLRIQDMDFGQGQIYVRDGKGGKDRTTYLPEMIADELRQHIERVKILHQQDLDEGFGAVYLPNALAKKYKNAAKETGWQYVFPGRSRSIDPRSKIERPHHVLESGL